MSGSCSLLSFCGRRGCDDVGGRGRVLNALIVFNGVKVCHLNWDFHAREELKEEDGRENRCHGPPFLHSVPVAVVVDPPPSPGPRFPSYWSLILC